MANTLKGKGILAISDWGKEELDRVLEMTFKFKWMGAD